MKGARLIQGFASIDREAREQMEKHARELRGRILAVAPEATFTETHDETVIECAAEHKEAVAEILRSSINVPWSKDAKLPEGTWWVREELQIRVSGARVGDVLLRPDGTEWEITEITPAPRSTRAAPPAVAGEEDELAMRYVTMRRQEREPGAMRDGCDENGVRTERLRLFAVLRIRVRRGT